jgi:hypothetical protein
MQLVPVQDAPRLFVESHVLPHPAQFDVVVVLVSQPFVLGGALSQSPKPGLHPA